MNYAGYSHLAWLNSFPLAVFLAFTPLFALLTRSWLLPMIHLALCVLSLWRYVVVHYVIRSPDIVSMDEMITGGFEHIREGDIRIYVINLAALVFVTGAVIFFIRYITRLNLEYETRASALSRYFSPAISKEIADGRLDLSADGHEEKPVAILFTDIVGFTKMSEQLSPSDTLKLLSEYQSLMVDAIFEYNGTVDKFIGDAVMANFGTPSSSEQDAENAFLCAMEMNRVLAIWNEDRKHMGLQEIEHRIGIHFGQCAVGNIGHKKRTEFAVIGDPV
ncbi:MAG: adenylate/guanylate cyclase domain-containing protein, partial [Alphaproteobacteria bacterium]|nr:adenylate/guanylate cyclase domain-containing protein [Alphaproteobacteria bacterium]